MSKQRDDKKRLEKAMALLALSSDGENAEVLQAECPTAEEIAVFSEGSGTEPGLSIFLGHLDRCDSCYRQWLLVNEDKIRQEQSSVTSRVRKYSYIGSALALAASIAVFLNIREPVPVFMQSDENEVLEETKMEQEAYPSTNETVLKSIQPSAEPKAMRESRADSEYDVLNNELDKSVTAEHEDITTKTMKEVDGLQSSPQKRIPSKAAVAGKARTEVTAPSVSLTLPENNSLSELNRWVEELHDGCLSGQRESNFWKSINHRGEIIYRESVPVLSISEFSLLKKLLLLINQMDERSISGQCEQILLILAEEDESR